MTLAVQERRVERHPLLSAGLARRRHQIKFGAQVEQTPTSRTTTRSATRLHRALPQRRPRLGAHLSTPVNTSLNELEVAAFVGLWTIAQRVTITARGSSA
jgi:hypothetical protein